MCCNRAVNWWRRVTASYGSSTMMVYTTGQGVHGFTLDPSIGEFLLSHPDIKQPAKPRYYSVNHSYEEFWTPGFQRYMRWLRDTEMKDSPELSMRYIGSAGLGFSSEFAAGRAFIYIRARCITRNGQKASCACTV